MNNISNLKKRYVNILQADDNNDDRADRDKRKIGIVKLGVTNGILGFVFGVSVSTNLK